MKSGWYAIRNKINGHCYIGSSVDLNLRKRAHWKGLRDNTHHCRYLQNAWNLYGEESFVWEVLELASEPYSRFCESALAFKNKLRLREQHYIDVFLPEYNMAKIVRAPRTGSKQSPETIAKRVAKTRGLKRTPEFCKRISEVQRNPSEETRLKKSAWQRGKPKPWARVPSSEEKKRKISQARAGQGNFRNGKTSPRSRSGEYGISWSNSRGKWIVQLKRTTYGSYSNLEDAVAHRDELLAKFKEELNGHQRTD